MPFDLADLEVRATRKGQRDNRSEGDCDAADDLCHADPSSASYPCVGVLGRILQTLTNRALTVGKLRT